MLTRTVLGWGAVCLLASTMRYGQDGKAWDPALGTAEVKGVVKFSGKAPKRKKLDMGADEACTRMHEKAPQDESVLVNENATLRNVFVWVKKGLGGFRFTPPDAAVELRQQGCTYRPRVFGIMVDQKLKICNDDDTLHNIHSLGQLNPEWNFGQPKKGSEDIKSFANAEIGLKFKCDVHGWMIAWACVTPHPFYRVTGEDGAFSLGKLPPGDYTIEAWHEKYGTQSLDLKLGDRETKEVEFSFEGK